MSKPSFKAGRLAVAVSRMPRVLLVLALFLFLCWPQPGTVQAAGGDLDLAFGDGGRVLTDIHTGDEIHALAIQPDGKIIAVGGVANFALARYHTDGTPDLSFGSGGKVSTRLRNTFSEAYAVALQPDGKIVVAGQAFDGVSGHAFAVARYNADGSLDSTFGSGGSTVTGFGGVNELARGVAIQPDGKIVVAGTTFVDFALARYNRDGSLDTTFGSAGKVVNDFGGGESINAVAIDSQGRILVSGRLINTNTLTSTDFVLARYRADGSLDPSFGSAGKVTTDFSGREDYAYSLIILPDEKIVLAGHADDLFEGNDFALARYNRNGSLDTTFGTGGKVTTDFFSNVQGSFSSSDLGLAAALQFDGKIIVAGTTNSGSGIKFALARYDEDGGLDTTFGSGGKITTISSGSFEAAYAIAIQDDGKFLVGGRTFTSGGSRGMDFALARFFSSTPRIISATVSGKKLLISGTEFSEKAVILINGIEQKTRNDGQSPTAMLIGKKAGKKIKAGDRIQIRNEDRSLSPEFIFTG